MKPDLAQVFHRRPEVRYRVIRDQAVVIVQDAGEAVVLNEVGSRILELVDGSRSAAQILELLERDYDADRAELERDLLEYLNDLLEAGILAEAST